MGHAIKSIFKVNLEKRNGAFGGVKALKHTSHHMYIRLNCASFDAARLVWPFRICDYGF